MRFLILDKRTKGKDPKNGEKNYVQARLTEELEKLNIDHKLALYEDIVITNANNGLEILIDGEQLVKFTHIILRGHRTATEYQLKRLITQHAIQQDKRVQNADFMLNTPNYNKLEQFARLTEAGINYLPTFYSSGHNYHSIINHSLEFPLIYKKSSYPFRIENNQPKKNIFLLQNEKELHTYAQEDGYPSDYLLQRYAPTGIDYRVIMLQDRVLCIIQRKAKDSFITVKNGDYIAYTEKESTPKLIDIAKQTHKLFKAEFSGVDIIELEGSYYVLEINMNPGFKALEQKTSKSDKLGDIDVAKAIIDAMLQS